LRYEELRSSVYCQSQVQYTVEYLIKYQRKGRKRAAVIEEDHPVSSEATL